MIWKKRLSLFLASLMILSMIQIVPTDVKSASHFENGVSSIKAASTEAPELSPGTPEEVKEAVLENLELSYLEESDTIVLNYQLKDCSYVRIYVNDKLLEEEYTDLQYEYGNVRDGMDYEFRVVPYNAKDEAGEGAGVSCFVPYKQAVVSEADADYNLERKVLIVDWEGESIAYADVYQDDVLIGSHVSDMRLILEIDLVADSKHTYKIVPYNRNDEVGTEKSFVYQVDDYVARIDTFAADYDENAKQIRINWTDTYTEYVEITLNDETLEEKYTGKTYVLNYELQPGATYIIGVAPYNYKNEEGDGEEEDISFGYFDIPEEFSASLVNVPVKDKNGNYTGFASPSVQLTWEAQGRAVYEIYRAEGNDKRGAYNWIANVKADKDGVYTYVDEKAGFLTYYYKIRRKIVSDDYTEQELYTALSDAEKVNAAVPKPNVKACLNEKGQIVLTMDSRREFVSGYEIYRKSGKGSYELLATVTDDEYIDEAVKFGKTYQYRARAYYYNSNTGKKVMGKYSKPSKVKNSINNIEVKAAAVSPDTIRISWTPAANVEKYEVYMKSGMQGDSYVLWKTTNSLSLKRKFKKGGTHYFMIKAYQTSENGKTYFSTAETSVKLGFSAPSGFGATKTSYSRNKKTNALIQEDLLTWNPVYGAGGYYLEVYSEATKKYQRVAKIADKRKTSYTVKNPVTEGSKPLKYRISAYSRGKVKKGEAIEIIPKLGTVKQVTAVKAGSKVKVSWKKVLGAERYQVYRSNGRTMILVGETAALSLMDQGLSAGVPYKYYVQAVNTAWKINGEKSDPVNYMEKQPKVSGLKAVNASGGTVRLSWGESKGAQNYIVYYKTSPRAKYQKLAEVTGKKTTFEHKNLKPGQTCYYQVIATQKNSGGIMTESEGVEVNITISQ
ncbi:MAG: hypothetical protein HFI82_03185 [Eubacterium sp.]|jgi:hypothetical protein|nr:hypothetical protein [Eubacterium sp.]